MVNKEEKYNLTTKTNTRIALMTCLFFLVVFVFFSSHLMARVSSLFHPACTYICSLCRQRKEEKKSAKEKETEDLAFFFFSSHFSFFSKKNDSRVVAHKKRENTRVCVCVCVCETVVVVVVIVALMTKGKKICLSDTVHFFTFESSWMVSQSVIFFSHRSSRRLEGLFFRTIERATHRRKGEMSQRKRGRERERKGAI